MDNAQIENWISTLIKRIEQLEREMEDVRRITFFGFEKCEAHKGKADP